VEGELKSAFGGKMPAGIELDAQSAPDSRALLIASSQFLANPLARAGKPADGDAAGGDMSLQMLAMPYGQQYVPSTILAFKGLLDWMTSDDDLLACSALPLEP
jgi:hypothetical protein